MCTIRLTGSLVCSTCEETRLVARHLPLHIALTRDEPGCVSFEVTQDVDPLTWRVEEVFEDEASFRAHQDRVSNSEWDRMTAGIERRYAVEGLAD